jgi:hypothetical protein
MSDKAASPTAPRGSRSSTCQRAGRRGRARIAMASATGDPCRQRATHEGTGARWLVDRAGLAA